MSATDLVTVNGSLPRIRSVSFHNGYEVTVSWDMDTRDGRTDVVDLAPLIFRLKFYAPLRDDRALMSTVHAIDEGTAIAWGDGEVDMAATSVLDLAEQSMSAADFSGFMKRHGLTFDRVAAELGISKRLAGYYAAGRSVPRYIAMACELMDLKAKKKPLTPGQELWAAAGAAKSAVATILGYSVELGELPPHHDVVRKSVMQAAQASPAYQEAIERVMREDPARGMGDTFKEAREHVEVGRDVLNRIVETKASKP